MSANTTGDRPVVFIAVTGGPCGGKTTFMAKAREYLVGRGFYPLVIPESATTLQLAGFPRSGKEWQDTHDFQREVLAETIDREHTWLRRAHKLRTDRSIVLLADRGICDIEAYAGKEVFGELLAEHNLTRTQALRRYHMVIHLVTVADGAPEHYSVENNAARTESPQEACTLDKLTQSAWHGHPTLAVIGNETGFNMKISRALESLRRILPFGPVFPVERERAFQLQDFRFEFLPSSAVRRDITQIYLKELVPGHERRLRKEVVHGVTTYTYTRKIGKKMLGVRDEISQIISLREYEDLLLERDLSLEPVLKTRYSFTHDNRHLELDDFHAPVSDLYLVEIENVERKEKIRFPVEWGNLVEVTGDSRYSNREIAGGSLAAAA